jgi:hypothetical protein
MITDSLGRKRRPSQDAALEPYVQRHPEGVVVSVHRTAMSEDADARFKALSPRERGELIERALRGA